MINFKLSSPLLLLSVNEQQKNWKKTIIALSMKFGQHITSYKNEYILLKYKNVQNISKLAFQLEK